MKQNLTSIHAVYAVWLRNIMVWRRFFGPSLSANIINPIFFLFAFGFGLGAIMENAQNYSYLAYVVPGMMAYATMFNASFETSIGSYTRFATLKVFDAMLSTPIRLRELIWGEMLWAATKGMISALGVMAAGAIFDGLPAGWTALVALPVLFLGGLCFAGVGLACTSHARGYEFFHYFFTFWVTPNFLFTGAFFSLERYPEWLQTLVLILPNTHLIHVMRPLTLGEPIDWPATFLHCGYLLLVAIAAFFICYRKFKMRLFD